MMKFYRQFYQTRTKKSSKQNIQWSIDILQGFRACTVLLMAHFPHYHDTEHYLHLNIPPVNVGILMIIGTYDNWNIYYN